MKYSSKEIFTISNGISFLRFLLVIPLWFLLDNYELESVRYITFALCVFAAATDMLDGFLARKLNQITEVGKIIDPLADKAAMAVIVIKLFLIGEISAFFFLTINRDQDLDYVLKILTKSDLEELPVVSDSDDKRIIGTISRHDILSTYNKESLKSDLAEGLSREINTLAEAKISRIADGYAIIEKRPHYNFIGKTLSELKLRNNYGLEVLMIKKSKELFDEDENNSRLVMPGHNYKIEADDILVLFGTDEKIAITKDW